MLSYCLVCKKITDNANTEKFMIKDGRLKINSFCTICVNTKVRYVNRWSGSLDNLMINYKHGKKQ